MASTLAADGRAAVNLVVNDAEEIIAASHRIREHAYILRHRSRESLAVRFARPEGDFDLVGTLPPLFPEWLGDRAFTEAHGCRFPYVVGEMARGIATPRMVCAASEAGLMGFYGSAGLALPQVDRGLQEIRTALGPSATSWGSNLIHSPPRAATRGGRRRTLSAAAGAPRLGLRLYVVDSGGRAVRLLGSLPGSRRTHTAPKSSLREDLASGNGATLYVARTRGHARGVGLPFAAHAR